MPTYNNDSNAILLIISPTILHFTQINICVKCNTFGGIFKEYTNKLKTFINRYSFGF